MSCKENGAWSPKPRLLHTVLIYFAGADTDVAGALVLVLALWLLLPSQARTLPDTETPNTNSIAIATLFI